MTAAPRSRPGPSGRLLPLAIGVVYLALAVASWRKWPDILVDFGRELYVPWQIASGRFYGRYQWSYTGDVLNAITDPDVQPSYTISDIKFGVEAESWEVYAYVDNLGNKRAILFNQQSAPPGTITINTPRTWGIGFTKTWGGGK